MILPSQCPFRSLQRSKSLVPEPDNAQHDCIRINVDLITYFERYRYCCVMQLAHHPYYGRSCVGRTTGIQSLSWASRALILDTLASLDVLLVLKMEDVALHRENSYTWLSRCTEGALTERERKSMELSNVKDGAGHLMLAAGLCSPDPDYERGLLLVCIAPHTTEHYAVFVPEFDSSIGSRTVTCSQLTSQKPWPRPTVLGYSHSL